MNELSESQCDKLDQILNMFGMEEHIDADKVLSVEPNERKANALLDFLVKKGFIIRIGEAIGRTLPLIINIEPAAELFIDNGGFMANFKNKRVTIVGEPTIVNIHNSGNNNVINTGSNSSITAQLKPTTDTKVMSNTLATADPSPYLESDLQFHGSGRTNEGYSHKNPIEIDEEGQGVHVIGFANKPIIFWLLDWSYLLTIHNNSSYPAYNVNVDVISVQQFSRLTKPNKINNLQPGCQLQLEAEFKCRLESTHVEADELLRPRIPTALNGLCLQITYLDEMRRQHVTIVTIEDQEVNNVKK